MPDPIRAAAEAIWQHIDDVWDLGHLESLLRLHLGDREADPTPKRLAEEIAAQVEKDSENSAGNAAEYAFDIEAVTAIIVRHMSQREAVLREALGPIIRQSLGEYRCQHITCNDGDDHLPLVDALTPPGDDSIERGEAELDLLADHLLIDIESALKGTAEARQ